MVCFTDERDFVRAVNSHEMANTPIPEKIHSLLSTTYVIRFFEEVILLLEEVKTEPLSRRSAGFSGCP